MTKNELIVLKILDLGKELGVSEIDMIGGLMSTIRYLCLDDEQSNEQLKKAFCEFIDKTVNLKSKFE